MSCDAEPFTIRVGNTLPIFEADAVVCGKPFDFTGWTLTFEMSGPVVITGAATGDANGLISYGWGGAADTALPGTYEAVIRGISPDLKPQTFPTKGSITVIVEP